MSTRAKLTALSVILAAAMGLSAPSRASISDVARADVDAKAISIVPFDQLKFEGKPGHAQSAVVFGDPDGDGLYGIVIKWPPHTGSRPHIHLHDRYVTVL